MNQNNIFIKVNGVGWNVKITKENQLILNVGYSLPVKVDIPFYLDVKVQPGDVVLSVKYTNKITKSNTESEVDFKDITKMKEIHTQRQKVGDFAAMLRRIRPWNIYTGQGIVRMDRVDNLIRRRGKRN